MRPTRRSRRPVFEDLYLGAGGLSVPTALSISPLIVATSRLSVESLVCIAIQRRGTRTNDSVPQGVARRLRGGGGGNTLPPAEIRNPVGRAALSMLPVPRLERHADAYTRPATCVTPRAEGATRGRYRRSISTTPLVSTRARSPAGRRGADPDATPSRASKRHAYRAFRLSVHTHRLGYRRWTGVLA
jgi:hypothetical protein